jgi:hypothetical protein
LEERPKGHCGHQKCFTLGYQLLNRINDPGIPDFSNPLKQLFSIVFSNFTRV